MESFTYVDIFATKGVEYLEVIGFLLLLIPFWIALNKPVKKAFRNGKQKLTALRHWFSFQEGRYYHQGHSWALPLGDNIVRVGIDDFAQKLVGRPESIQFPHLGANLTQGDIGWEMIVDSKMIRVLSPVNGKVRRINQKVLQSPDIINQDPYNNGWLLEIEAPRIKADIKNLLVGKLAKDWSVETVRALRATMAGDLGVVMQDGGVPVEGFAKSLSPEKWDEIAAEFLLTK